MQINMCIFFKNILYRCLYFNEKRVLQLLNRISSKEIDVANIEKTEIASKSISRWTYEQLMKATKNDRELYLQCLKVAQYHKIQALRSSNKVRIAFQTASLTTWIGDEILERFSLDERYDVTVVFTWQRNTIKEDEFSRLSTHFSSCPSRIHVKKASLDVSPRDFDIIIYTAPYLDILDQFELKDLFLSTLVCYIPYGIYIAGIQEWQFNLFIHNINWKNFITSKYHLKLGDKYCTLLGRRGMVYSGYPKLDELYDLSSKFQWKLPMEGTSPMKIILAPHHSIDSAPYYSTFALNYKFFFEYARTHSQTTSWVFKPHPLLKVAAVKFGVFKSYDEYDAYLKKWNDLPNAKVLEGEYLDAFKDADCMILDSVSFMAEFLYVNKPILFLTRSDQNFNEFGEKCKSVLYQCQGNDFETITQFLHMVQEQNDPLAIARDHFFRKYLDYYRENKMSASEYVYHNITNDLFGE